MRRVTTTVAGLLNHQYRRLPAHPVVRRGEVVRHEHHAGRGPEGVGADPRGGGGAGGGRGRGAGGGGGGGRVGGGGEGGGGGRWGGGGGGGGRGGGGGGVGESLPARFSEAREGVEKVFGHKPLPVTPRD